MSEDQTDWDLFLPCAMYAMNDSQHASTGLTPFEVVFGRRPMTPAALLVGAPPAPTDNLHAVNAEAELTVQRTR